MKKCSKLWLKLSVKCQALKVEWQHHSLAPIQAHLHIDEVVEENVDEEVDDDDDEDLWHKAWRKTIFFLKIFFLFSLTLI